MKMGGMGISHHKTSTIGGRLKYELKEHDCLLKRQESYDYPNSLSLF